MSYGTAWGYGKQSSTQWEKSFYGGFYNLIFDHPEINIDFDLEYDTKNTMGLPWHINNKLIKIFLLKIKEFNLIDQFMINCTVEKRKKYFREFEAVVVNPNSLKSSLESIIQKDSELGNLFSHYSAIILSTEVYYELPKEPPPPPKVPTSASGEESPSFNDGPPSPPPPPTPEGPAKAPTVVVVEEMKKSKFKDALGAVAKREKFFTVNSVSNALFKEGAKFLHHENGKKTRYRDEHHFFAGQLVKMLDISFDPKRDRVTSQRTGKLDQRKIGEVPGGNLNIYYSEEENQSTKPFSVCILCDESGSMAEYGKIHRAKDLMKVLYLSFSQILPQDKIFVYGHSGYSAPAIFVYQDKYNHTFEERIDALTSRSSNYDGPAIEKIYEKIREFTDDNIIFIVLSDGQPAGQNYGAEKAVEEMKKILEKCRRDGFVTVGLGIKYFTFPGIYNYSTIIDDLGMEMMKKTAMVINKVVKTEFQ